MRNIRKEINCFGFRYTKVRTKVERPVGQEIRARLVLVARPL